MIWGDSLWDAFVRPEHEDESHGAWELGNWRVPWGEINRFQRVTDDIVPHFSDAEPSVPVPFTSSRWGSLASFGAKSYPGTRRYYGTDGNSFVAVVEFGPKIRAVAVTAGGESGDPHSAHFNDEAIATRVVCCAACTSIRKISSDTSSVAITPGNKTRRDGALMTLCV